MLVMTEDGVCDGRTGGRGCWWLCSLDGMPFSERNSSRSMYSSWKLSPSYASVLSHRVGPRKADCGAALTSSSSDFAFSSFPNPEHTHTRQVKRFTMK